MCICWTPSHPHGILFASCSFPFWLTWSSIKWLPLFCLQSLKDKPPFFYENFLRYSSKQTNKEKHQLAAFRPVWDTPSAPTTEAIGDGSPPKEAEANKQCESGAELMCSCKQANKGLGPPYPAKPAWHTQKLADKKKIAGITQCSTWGQVDWAQGQPLDACWEKAECSAGGCWMFCVTSISFYNQ